MGGYSLASHGADKSPMETSIRVEPALRGWKVSIEVGRETWVFVWDMSREECQREAEEIVRRQKAA
jgi:hypothetical protein